MWNRCLKPWSMRRSWLQNASMTFCLCAHLISDWAGLAEDNLLRQCKEYQGQSDVHQQHSLPANLYPVWGSPDISGHILQLGHYSCTKGVYGNVQFPHDWIVTEFPNIWYFNWLKIQVVVQTQEFILMWNSHISELGAWLGTESAQALAKLLFRNVWCLYWNGHLQ